MKIHAHLKFPYFSSKNTKDSLFLDPVGSVHCGLVVGCHTFSNLVSFECFGVVMMEG